MTQTTLFDQPAVRPRYDTLAARAEAWIAANPRAVALFERYALQMATAGRKFGMKALAERVRWEASLATSGEFKVNNSYVAHVARWLVKKHPQLKGYMEFRHAEGDNQ